MNKNLRTNSLRIFELLAVLGLGLCFQPWLQADVVVLQNGGVLTGTILQQDASGVLIQTETGTYRYPPSWIQNVKKEPAAAPHVSNNGQSIPDWAQMVSLLANNTWADGLKQVPAAMIESGAWKNVPYISFRCAAGGYEVNIFGDLSRPAAVQIGAMSYLSQDPAARSNCVNFICSVLANANDRKMVRALNFSQKDVQKAGGMTVQTILPGEWGSYGGWWVSICNDDALASAQASEAELLAITQSRTAPAQPVAAPAPPATTTNAAVQLDASANAQPATPIAPPVVTTTYGTTYGNYYPGWTAEELAAARPVAPGQAAPYPAATGARADAAAAPAEAHPAAPSDRVYPRTYDRAGGSYGAHRR